MLVGLPARPASSISASHDACIKLPVMSPSCLPNFSIVWMCAITCSVYRFGILSPPHCHGLWTIALGNDLMKHANGWPWASIGCIISAHCCCVKVVATRGYSSFWNIIWCIPNSAAKWVTLAVAINCCHCLDASTRCWNSALSLPSGASQTPSVLWTSNAFNCGITLRLPLSPGTCNWCSGSRSA